MMKDQCERIRQAEAALKRAEAALDHLENSYEQYLDAQEDFALLERYLNSEERREDLLADEEGRLPEDLPRGVLSEDGVWNLLERRDELMDEMKSLTDIK